MNRSLDLKPPRILEKIIECLQLFLRVEEKGSNNPMGATGFEPVTPCLKGRCSNRAELCPRDFHLQKQMDLSYTDYHWLG